MIAMLKAQIPGHAYKQAAQAFMSPDIPKRNEAVKEIGSIGYYDDGGAQVVFLFDVPDALMSEFVLIQSKRTAFISARAPGFNASIQYGQKLSEGIPVLLPMYP